MWLRVNVRHQDRQHYLQRLEDAQIAVAQVDEAGSGICLLQACDVELLPGFADGDCSVQDAAAQRAAWLLNPQPGDLILDACAAPGGKTAHLLEQEPQLAGVIAVDADAQRLLRVGDTGQDRVFVLRERPNLDRLGRRRLGVVQDDRLAEEHLHAFACIRRVRGHLVFFDCRGQRPADGCEVVDPLAVQSGRRTL